MTRSHSRRPINFPLQPTRAAPPVISGVTQKLRGRVSDEQPKPAKLLTFPPGKEDKDVAAFIGHYLALADLLLSPNVERERPDEKSEPYLDHDKSSG